MKLYTQEDLDAAVAREREAIEAGISCVSMGVENDPAFHRAVAECLAVVRARSAKEV